MKREIVHQEKGKRIKDKGLVFLLSTFYFLLSTISFATTYKLLTLEDIIDKTEIAFYGEVTAVEVEAREGEPWTVVSFNVTDSLAMPDGVLDEESEGLELAFYGGDLSSGQSLKVSLMPQFSVGESVLVMAYNRGLYSPIVGFRQGLWRDTTLGLRSETGEFLGVNETGGLIQGEDAANNEAVFEAIKTALEGAE